MYDVAVLTISDSGADGRRKDASGEAVIAAVRGRGHNVVRYGILPDEASLIAGELRTICDQGLAQLILTTGGTGFSPRDVTPEATLAVLERLCPGIPEAMRARSLALTDRAMLSRAVAGIRGGTLILNLPGSPKAVRECLSGILEPLEHGLAILSGRDSECAR
jgi:molybdenum cofactor synthesis domain-containing protein